MDKEEIRRRLTLVLSQLETMHEIASIRASMLGIVPKELMTPSGDLVLVPIFVAQAHALSALVTLDKNG